MANVWRVWATVEASTAPPMMINSGAAEDIIGTLMLDESSSPTK